MVLPELVDEYAPTELPDAQAGWVRDLMRLTPTDVLRETIATWPALKQTAWKFAFLVARIQREGLYRPHGSLTEWARVELGRDSAVVSKYRQAADLVLSLEDPAEQAAVMTTPPAVLSEAGVPALARRDRQKAVELASRGLTQRELKEAVRSEQADRLHLEPGGLKTVRVVLSEPAYRAFMGAWHLIAFACQGLPPPRDEAARVQRDSAVAEALAAELGDALQIDPMVAARFAPGRPGSYADPAARAAAGLAAIRAGQVHCLDCWATNGADLEAHHVIPRSHGGGDGPIAWLCRDCHRRVTENEETTWRVALRRWMEAHRWLAEAVEQWLGTRRLEDV